ncbi:MAG: FxsA family protein [Helicobacteraceae bacterium]
MLLVFAGLVAETICSLAFVSYFGFWAFLAEVLVSFGVGFLLIKDTTDRFSNLLWIFENAQDPRQILGSLGRIFGAFLLMLPGVLTDLAGLYFVFFRQDPPARRKPSDDIIDVEVIEK